LQGFVAKGRECTGMVKLGTQLLGCDDPNGYRLKDDRQTLELTFWHTLTQLHPLATSPQAVLECADTPSRC
jgi:hypothetical protein